MGLDASKPALFKKPLDTYRSVVFATHGYFGKELAGIQEPVLVLTMVDQPEGSGRLPSTQRGYGPEASMRTWSRSPHVRAAWGGTSQAKGPWAWGVPSNTPARRLCS